ncbi:hypothetical protein [Paraburkholderia megapolitana]|uniref:hypothetical protein n=1 Tax=Paraburkholderia megapolitana TaxID=420953 RepID=UPI0038BD9D42
MTLERKLRIVRLVKRTGAVLGPLCFLWAVPGGIDLVLVASKHRRLFHVPWLEISAWTAFGLLVVALIAGRWLTRRIDAEEAS